MSEDRMNLIKVNMETDRCKRCGKEIFLGLDLTRFMGLHSAYHVEWAFNVAWGFTETDSASISLENNKAFLCKDCAKSFKAWWRMVGENND